MKNVQPGHFRLNQEQRHFKGLLDRYPRLISYWDFNDRSVDLDAVDRDIAVMSHGEQLMLNFFVAVWLGETRHFDFIDAARSLDDADRQVIVEWLNSPVLP